ncbi:MAG: toll/interleukin-1 receptor domain-containing protein, partial [Burkholderiales bacterium]|nr:toll/interleukin-1 receptor domain-containing protein [Burkholderiales bacterium]
LPPGVPWRPVLELLICRADRVLLVWSRRAAASTEVARELQTARLCGVPVVPVLLDSTPLPADVGQIHAVDWR